MDQWTVDTFDRDKKIMQRRYAIGIADHWSIVGGKGAERTRAMRMEFVELTRDVTCRAMT